MIRFLAGRALGAAIVLAVMSFVIFALMGLMPGDPIDIMVQADPNLTSADAVRLKQLYGLDLSIWERYWNWLGGALNGDFGYSRTYSRPVMAIIGPRLANTLVLLGLSSALAIAIAIPLGILAAARPHTRIDGAVNLFCFAGISVPPFWLAILLIMLFAVSLGLLPAGGAAPLSGASLAGRARHLVLPVTTLTLASLAAHTRFMRAAMLEALRQDYVRTARAKGANERRTLLHHALRNALLPLVTVIALDFGTLFSGALITETVFAYLGMGKLIYDSIMGNDYNVAMVALMLATLVVLVGNFFADLAYALIDPRISFLSQERAR